MKIARGDLNSGLLREATLRIFLGIKLICLMRSPDQLKLNKRYALSNRHMYTTDSEGRVTRVHGGLEQGILLDRNEYRQRGVGQTGGSGFDGGHLIATQLGVAGDDVNMVPMERYLNRVEYFAMEREFRAHLEAGRTVNVAIRVEYPPKISIPKELIVQTWVDGNPKTFRFKQ